LGPLTITLECEACTPETKITMRLHSIVQVIDAIDVDIHDDTTFQDALLVGFCDGSEELFWPEELAKP
jgi:hypothetical protein